MKLPKLTPNDAEEILNELQSGENGPVVYFAMIMCLCKMSKDGGKELLLHNISMIYDLAHDPEIEKANNAIDYIKNFSKN